MEFRIVREFFGKPQDGKEGFTLGSFYAEGTRMAYSCEDEDRHLEDGGEKLYGKTCIPRGRYLLVVDFSHRFQKLLPRLVGVPGYEGVRLHGGNRAENSHGCPLIGYSRTSDGVSNCAPAIKRIIELIENDADMGRQSWLTIT